MVIASSSKSASLLCAQLDNTSNGLPPSCVTDRRQRHCCRSCARAAALTINNQLKVVTAGATETATMTATTMTIKTKATAATCCCLCRRRRKRHAIAKLPPPPPSWQIPTRCRRASTAAIAYQCGAHIRCKNQFICSGWAYGTIGNPLPLPSPLLT